MEIEITCSLLSYVGGVALAVCTLAGIVGVLSDDRETLAIVGGIGFILSIVLTLVTGSMAGSQADLERLESLHPQWAQLYNLSKEHSDDMERIALNNFAAENPGCPTTLTADDYKIIWRKVHTDNEPLLADLFGSCVVLDQGLTFSHGGE